MSNYGMDLQGEELQNFGRRVFSKLGLTCFTNLPQVPLQKLDKTGVHGVGNHLEFDYLIPVNDMCLIGEISSRSTPKHEKEKFGRFSQNFNLVSKLSIDDEFWRQLGIQDSDLHYFKGVTKLRGFTITTKLQKFDLDFAIDKIVPFYLSDWKLIADYADVLGNNAKNIFLSKFNTHDEILQTPLIVNKKKHGLLRNTKKLIASNAGVVSLYTFQLNPYMILPMALVYRRDNLPSLKSELDYQRPLIHSKLEAIRRNLLDEPNFMFPGNILVVLSKNCKYDANEDELSIPCHFGAISIIDGQHRLFSYADDNLRLKIADTANIMITAIEFETDDEIEIVKYSAKAFVEINTKQTSVDQAHIDAISYSVLGETSNRALAAEVILRSNQTQKKCLHGIFKSNLTGLGIIQSVTVLSELKAITNLKVVSVLRGKHSAHKKIGYENLLDAKMDELMNPEVLIKKTVIGLVRFFGIVAKEFDRDWPERGGNNLSSLALSKMFAAFVRLFKEFIYNGDDWAKVEEKISSIRKNILKLRKLDPDTYDDLILDSRDTNIPGPEPSTKDLFDFLSANISTPTSIQPIIAKKRERVRTKTT